MQKSMRLLAAIVAPAPALPYAQELRVFPPPAPVVSPIQGAIDLHVHRVSMKAMAGAIKELGAERILIATDLGQTVNPTHPDGMMLLMQGLKQAGVSDADIDRMMRKNPAWLLGLE